MKRGEPIMGAEFKKLKVGDWFWVRYAKDDDPNRLMVDGPVQVKDVFDGGVETKSEDWRAPWADDVSMSDTSRGFAYYYEVIA